MRARVRGRNFTLFKTSSFLVLILTAWPQNCAAGDARVNQLAQENFIYS